jgi:hypothetical protein
VSKELITNLGGAKLLPPAIEDVARAVLSSDDYARLVNYVCAGKHALAVSLSAQLLNLFLAGHETLEIHRLNPSIPYEAILWARCRDRWDAKRDQVFAELSQSVAQKLTAAKLGAVTMLSDYMVAISKHHGEALQRYIQTGDAEGLPADVRAGGLKTLIKAVEALSQATAAGKDKSPTINLSVNTTAPAQSDVKAAGISPEAASQVLAIVAADKRRS